MSLFGPFAFDIPAQFVTQFTNGEIVRYGAILKNVGTGQIVGHLQETGSVGSILSGIPNVFSPVNTLSSLGANYQLFRVSRQVNALQTLVEGVQALQLANLAMGALGIGVTIAGFTHLNKCLNDLDKKLNTIDEKLDKVLSALRHLTDQQTIAAIKNCNHDLSAGLQSVDAALKMKPNQRDDVIGGVATSMMKLLVVYPSEIDIGLQRKMSYEVVNGLIGSYSVAAALRVQCLLMIDQNEAAVFEAERIRGEANHLFDQFNYVTVRRMLSNDEDAPEDRTLVTLMAIREVQDMIASRALMVDNLAQQGISGRAYVEAVRQQKEPLLVVRPA